MVSRPATAVLLDPLADAVKGSTQLPEPASIDSAFLLAPRDWDRWAGWEQSLQGLACFCSLTGV